MTTTNTIPLPDAERIRVLNEYAEFLSKVQAQFDKFWQNTINLKPLNIGFVAALQFIHAMQRGDTRLRVIFDVPVHLLLALIKAMMRRQLGGDDDYA